MDGEWDILHIRNKRFHVDIPHGSARDKNDKSSVDPKALWINH
jgi:hypothetical protein